MLPLRAKSNELNVSVCVHLHVCACIAIYFTQLKKKNKYTRVGMFSQERNLDYLYQSGKQNKLQIQKISSENTVNGLKTTGSNQDMTQCCQCEFNLIAKDNTIPGRGNLTAPAQGGDEGMLISGINKALLSVLNRLHLLLLFQDIFSLVILTMAT